MATSAVIAAFSRTMVSLLQAGLDQVVNAQRVVLATPDDFSGFSNPASPAVTIFLYRVAVQTEMRNRPWRSLPDGRRARPFLPLELSYLVTAWAQQTDDEHRIIGRVLQTLYDRAEISAADLQEPAAWEPGDSVQLVLDSLPMEDHMRLWDSVDMPYRLSLAYYARVVGIAPAEARAVAPVVDADLRPGRWEPEASAP